MLTGLVKQHVSQSLPVCDRLLCILFFEQLLNGLLGVSLGHGLFSIIMITSGPVSRDMMLTLTFFVEGVEGTVPK